MGHLLKEQRYAIQVMLDRGDSQADIARSINRHKSVVSREVARNSDGRNGRYRCDLAQRKYDDRMGDKPRKHYMTTGVCGYVDGWLSKKYSPEQIVATALKEGVACVSHERIYQYIWKDKRNGGKLYANLRTEGKSYAERGAEKGRRGCIKGRVDISERPAIVEEKKRIGDVEMDTIIGKGHKGAILTINDRATGVIRIRKLAGKDSAGLADSAIDALKSLVTEIHTITTDNGKEFAEHTRISSAFDAGYYFATPYHSWERGANENVNRLIRQYIPKKTDFDTVTEEYVQYVEDELNNRPRKRYNYSSPNEVFNTFIQTGLVAFAT